MKLIKSMVEFKNANKILYMDVLEITHPIVISNLQRDFKGVGFWYENNFYFPTTFKGSPKNLKKMSWNIPHLGIIEFDGDIQSAISHNNLWDYSNEYRKTTKFGIGEGLVHTPTLIELYIKPYKK